jgi:type 1 glutamine amidotransferase
MKAFPRVCSLALVLTAALPLVCVRAADPPGHDPYDQSKVPLEVEPADPNLPKIVLVAGRASHGPGDHEFFSGTAILMKCLKQNGVGPVMARDGWPKNEAIFKGAKSVVLYMDGGGGHPLIRPDRMELMRKLIDEKCGFVNLHYAVEYPKRPGDTILNWLGGFYEQGYSINPHWVAKFDKLPDHPIARGVKPFAINDEWYFNMRFSGDMKGVAPILVATPPDEKRGTAAAKSHPGRPEVLAWAFERPDGGRGFGFTGGHVHKNWGDENFRRLVVNAILWSARVEVPSGGAKVDIDPIDLNSNLDRKTRGFGGPKAAGKKKA